MGRLEHSDGSVRQAAVEAMTEISTKGNEEAIVGVRDCPYGICCPWVRGGWDLDALGKFFRRRRRRRHQGFRYFLVEFLLKVSIVNHFPQKMKS